MVLVKVSVGNRVHDPKQLAFELYGPLELANYLSVLYRDPSLVERGRAAVAATIASAKPQTCH